MCVYMCMCACVYIYIYIYIVRSKGRSFLQCSSLKRCGVPMPGLAAARRALAILEARRRALLGSQHIVSSYILDNRQYIIDNRQYMIGT